MQVRVVSYNVRSFREGFGEVLSVAAASEPDILLLQDAGARRELRRFADALGMQAVSTHRAFHPVHNAVAARPPWRIHRSSMGDYDRPDRTIPRGYVLAELRASTARLTAVATHLGLSAKERARHARELTDLVAGAPGPAVVGVDLNEGPEGPAARWVSERLFDAFATAGQGSGDTFPAARPTARVDFVFVTDGLTVTGATVPGGTSVREASDHRPVVVQLELPGE